MRNYTWLLAPVSLSACVLSTNGLGTADIVGAGGSTVAASSSSASNGDTSSNTTATSTSTGQGGSLVQPTCADHIQNGLETDVDCGGDACGPCKLGQNCDNSADCATLACTGGKCVMFTPGCVPAKPGDDPTCNDCVKNGSETDIDCGGDACGSCKLGQSCGDSADCATGNCDMGKCAPLVAGCVPANPGDDPTCNDCVQNGSETDIDCGGDVCSPCIVGQSCLDPSDCVTGSCDMGKCDAFVAGCVPAKPGDDPTCNDCVKNGLETDVDCGGDACGPCESGKSCADDGDCLSAACVSLVCQKGVAGKPCRRATDCATSQCAVGACWTGLCCQ